MAACKRWSESPSSPSERGRIDSHSQHRHELKGKASTRRWTSLCTDDKNDADTFLSHLNLRLSESFVLEVLKYSHRNDADVLYCLKLLSSYSSLIE
ncbi:hypothetical protein QYF36_019605 [Acer negundo]|nr:hypothetical protein QYF36_019605 [Acer negundo]